MTNKTFNQYYKSNFKSLREAQSKLGVTRQSLNMYLRGKQKPTLDAIRAIEENSGGAVPASSWLEVARESKPVFKILNNKKIPELVRNRGTTKYQELYNAITSMKVGQSIELSRKHSAVAMRFIKELKYKVVSRTVSKSEDGNNEFDIVGIWRT